MQNFSKRRWIVNECLVKNLQSKPYLHFSQISSNLLFPALHPGSGLDFLGNSQGMPALPKLIHWNSVPQSQISESYVSVQGERYVCFLYARNLHPYYILVLTEIYNAHSTFPNKQHNCILTLILSSNVN